MPISPSGSDSFHPFFSVQKLIRLMEGSLVWRQLDEHTLNIDINSDTGWLQRDHMRFLQISIQKLPVQAVQLRVLREFSSIWWLWFNQADQTCLVHHQSKIRGNSWGTLTSYMPDWTGRSGASVFCHKNPEACTASAQWEWSVRVYHLKITCLDILWGLICTHSWFLPNTLRTWYLLKLFRHLIPIQESVWLWITCKKQ